jgi:hypothetical protein
MRNPCRDCEHLLGDKKNERCAECLDRQTYLTYLKNPDHFKEEFSAKPTLPGISGNQKNKKRPWPEEEKTFLRDNYWRYSVVEIADILDRTQNTVSTMLSKLGINKTDSMYRKIIELENRIKDLEVRE